MPRTPEKTPRAKLLMEMFDLTTEYMVDECPDGTNWEDFDSDIDDLRSQVIDLYEQETGRTP